MLTVCHSCGTRYGDIPFERPVNLFDGVCDLCSKAGKVANEGDYSCLPNLNEKVRGLAEQVKLREVKEDVR